MDGHSFLLHRLERAELGLHVMLIFDEAVEGNGFLKFRTLVSICLLDF
jgi:hypothetical protein